MTSALLKTDSFELPLPTDSARHVLRSEADALMALAQSLDERFEQAVYMLENTKSRVIVTGMGKSGHIAKKVAATLASTGTPSFFIHPSEASHGDLGMISQDDSIIAFSNSGNTKELSDIIHYSRRFSIPLIAVTSDPDSYLAKHSDIALLLPDIEEACPMKLAPTTSTIMMLALGDALAVALLERHGFSENNFKIFHPGGQLGHALRKVEDLMQIDDRLPLIHPQASLEQTLDEMTSKGLGCVGVINHNRQLIGIITDGDLRRHIKVDLSQICAQDLMTASPKTIGKDDLIAKAIAIMNAHRITALFITNAQQEPVGILHIHDCLKIAG